MGILPMSLDTYNGKVADYADGYRVRSRTGVYKPLVLVVEDHEDTRSAMNEVLELKGYTVIDTDNGQDAIRHARNAYPDLVLVDLDVPLLYELVAARQIMKQAQLGVVPFVIVTHEDVLDPAALMEVGVRSNEYVTRLSDYQQLENLLDYLLPVEPQAA